MKNLPYGSTIQLPSGHSTDLIIEHRLFRSDAGHMFALSWLITWFAHVINDPDSIFRLFDFFLGTHPLMPIYLGAAVSRNALR